MYEDWNPDRILEQAAEERRVRDLDHKGFADKMMEENLDYAVYRLIHIIKYSTQEKLAFDASRYLIERMLGKVPDYGESAASDQLLDLVYSINDSDTGPGPGQT